MFAFPRRDQLGQHLSCESTEVVLFCNQWGAFGGSAIRLYNQTHVHAGDQWISLRADTACVLSWSWDSFHYHGRTLAGEWSSSARLTCKCHRRCPRARRSWLQYLGTLISVSICSFSLLALCNRLLWRVEFFRASTQSGRLQRV